MKRKICYASGLASMAAIVSIFICKTLIERNLLIYIISLLCYFIVYCSGMLLFRKDDEGKKNGENVRISIYSLGAFGILGLGYIADSTPFYPYYGWNFLPIGIVLITVILGVWMSVYTIITQESKGIMIPIYIYAVIAYTFSRYNPNVINAGVYDTDAYLTSIYNVFSNVPYTVESTGIYGHYGIFFKIPMMIFGGDVLTISIMIAVVSAITMTCFCYGVNSLIKNNYIRILVVLSALLEPLYTLPYGYFQSSPHRYLFPSMIMALIAYDMKDRRKSNIWIGGLISSLGILWNLESGIVTAAAWFVYLSISELQNSTNFINRNMIRNFLMMPMEVLLAIGGMVIYNIQCGGKPCVSVFFYPYNHHLEDFALPLRWGHYAYIYVIPILMSMFMWSVCNIKKFGNRNSYAGVIGAVSTMAIGLFAYYMNRFVACNAWLMFWQFALLLGILAEKSIVHVREIIKEKKATLYIGLKSALGIFSICILTTFSLGNVFSWGMQQKMYTMGSKNLTQMKDWVQEVAEVVPENTFAAGGGTGALYSMLGWDTGYHINDLPNLVARPEAYDQFIKELYEKEAAFVSNDIMEIDILLENGNFYVAHTFDFGRMKYFYIVKNE